MGLRATTTLSASGMDVRLLRAMPEPSYPVPSSLSAGAVNCPIVSGRPSGPPAGASFGRPHVKPYYMDNVRVKSIRWRAGTIIGDGEMPRHLVEEQRRGDGDVERRHPAPERDAHHAIAPVAHEPVESPALSADHQRHGWGERDRVVALGPGGVRAHDPHAFG